ncbi:MAG: hypothetical protein KR126chlam6_00602 [Candidatus Anoxychlamydiales bacterium]|nr:hypothetical protein [Candidatus Anoxychlamydiales bacterium]
MATEMFRLEASENNLYLRTPIGQVEFVRSDPEESCEAFKFMTLKVHRSFGDSVKDQLFTVLAQIIENTDFQTDKKLEDVVKHPTYERWSVKIDHFTTQVMSTKLTIILDKKVDVEVLCSKEELKPTPDEESSLIQLKFDEHNNIYLQSAFIEDITPYGSEIGDDKINKYFQFMDLSIWTKDLSDVLKQLSSVVRKIIACNSRMWMNSREDDNNTVEINFSQDGKTKPKKVKISVEYTYPKKGSNYLSKLNGFRNQGAEQKPRQEQGAENNPLYVVQIPTASFRRLVDTI